MSNIPQEWVWYGLNGNSTDEYSQHKYAVVWENAYKWLYLETSIILYTTHMDSIRNYLGDKRGQLQCSLEEINNYLQETLKDLYSYIELHQ